MTLATIRNGTLLFLALVSLARATTLPPSAGCGVAGFGPLGAHALTEVAELPDFPASRPLRLEDRAVLDQLFGGCQPDCSQFNFTALWGWHPHDHYTISRKGDAVLLSMEGPSGRIFLQPLGVSPDKAAQTIRDVLAHPDGRPFSHVSKAIADLLGQGDALKITSQRDLYEYVYHAGDLVDLQRHKELRYKKKQVDEFFAAHDGKEGRPKAEYLSLNEHPELLPKVEKYLEDWLRERAGDKTLDDKSKAEGVASRITLQHFHDFGLKGGVILVNGEVAAFSIGQRVNATTFAIYVEKADPGKYKGSYQAINQRFASDIAASGFSFINRMDDWGVPGLRRAKLSYQPSHLVENFGVDRRLAGESP